MKPLFDSFWRAAGYCLHPRVIALSLLPLLVTGVLTLGLSYLFWESALAAVRSALESWSLVNSMLQWMSEMLGAGFRTVFEQMILIALEIPIVVAFVLVLVGLWTTPAAVAMVAKRRFATLERRHGGAWWKGAVLSLAYTLAALVMVLVTLPLWLVPGLALILPPLIWGWLAAKVMGFDALAEHASAPEREAILRAHRWPMLLIGILTGFLCGIPSLIWTLSPMLLIAGAARDDRLRLAVYDDLHVLGALVHALRAHGARAPASGRGEDGRGAAGRLRGARAADRGGGAAARSPRPVRRRRRGRWARGPPAMSLGFGALIIGDEILSGRREDQHLARVIAALESRGLALAWARYIGDEPARIVAELRAAAAAGDAVFSFGGIGATPDDHTRQCAAAALGRPLVLHPQAKALIEQRARRWQQEKGVALDPAAPEHQRRLQLGVFPQGATLIPNPYNRIPGFSVGHLHFLPGFPVMAHPMLEWVIDTCYPAEIAAGGRAFHAVRVRGANESALIPVFERIECDFPGVKTFSLPSVDHPTWGVHIELGVKGEGAARVADAMAALREGAAATGAQEIAGTAV